MSESTPIPRSEEDFLGSPFENPESVPPAPPEYEPERNQEPVPAQNPSRPFPPREVPDEEPTPPLPVPQEGPQAGLGENDGNPDPKLALQHSEAVLPKKPLQPPDTQSAIRRGFDRLAARLFGGKRNEETSSGETFLE